MSQKQVYFSRSSVVELLLLSLRWVIMLILLLELWWRILLLARRGLLIIHELLLLLEIVRKLVRLHLARELCWPRLLQWHVVWVRSVAHVNIVANVKSLGSS